MAEGTPQSAGLSKPLGLIQALSRPDQRMDFVPLFDVLLIALLLMLLGSRFLFPPGVALDLPSVADGYVVGSPTAAVMTVTSDDMIFFKGRHFTRDSIQRYLLADPALDHRLENGGVLLLKVGREVNVQTLLTLSRVARQAGYLQVQIATRTEPGAAVFQDSAGSTPR